MFVEQEVLEQVDNLRYTWGKLQEKALSVHVNLLKMQPHFEEDLKTNLEKFRQDKMDYCEEYKNAGPMEAGLTPREASDRLILFQVGSVFVCVSSMLLLNNYFPKHIKYNFNTEVLRNIHRNSTIIGTIMYSSCFSRINHIFYQHCLSHWKPLHH